MAKRGWWIAGAGLALAIAALLAWRGTILPIHVAAPEPLLTADLTDSLPRVPPSFVVAPVAFDLGPAVAQLEADVPRHFGSLDRRLRADSSSRTSVAFAASRSPFRVSVDGADIVIETVLEYEGRGWYDPPIGPEVSAGCGKGDDPKPRLVLRLRSTPSLTPEWGLRTRSEAEVLRFSDQPCDQCQVTILKIDVTDRVIVAVREAMTRRLARFDRQVTRRDARGQFERIWRKMERPIRLTDGVWLLIQPRAAQLASYSGAGDSLTALVRLEARPIVVTGGRPPDSTTVTPLPPLRLSTEAGADTGSGLHLTLDGVFSYDAATDLLRRRLVGKVIRLAGRRVQIADVTLGGIGSGRVALGITFQGAIQGRVFLSGTPRLDPVTRQLSVPDLEYDVGSADLLARSLLGRRGHVVRDYLRAKATIPDSIALAGLERLAERGMNRELTDGVRLEATLSDSRGVAVRATREQLVVRAVAEGQARLAVDRVLGRIKPRSSHRR